MPELNIYPFSKVDIETIHLRASDRIGKELFSKIANHSKIHEMAWSLVGDDNVYAIGCLLFLWRGVAQAAMIFSEELEKDKDVALSAFWKIKGIMRREVKKFGLHRVQASVIAEYPERRRWLELMGFQVEAFAERYGPNKEDCVIMRYLP